MRARVPASCLPLLALPLLLGGARLAAGSMPELTETGDRLYAAAKYSDAAEQYTRLLQSPSLPARPELAASALYNRGNALYRLGRFAAARDSYEQAAVKTRNLEVEGRAAYNIGNCYYREAEEQVGTGALQSAATSLEASIAAFRRALELDSSRKDAGVNLEVARIFLKGVRDEIAKYGGVQDLQRQIVEKLRRLIGSQGTLIARSDDPESDTAELRDAQEKMRIDTVGLLGLFDTLLGRLERLQGRSQESNPYAEARRSTARSESYQGNAVAILGSGDRAGALVSQRDSEKALERALEILTPPEREDRSEQGPSTSGTEDSASGPSDDGSGSSGAANPQSAPGQDRSSAGAAGEGESQDRPSAGTAEKPEDILQEEGFNRTMRPSSPGGAPVDKDW